MLTKASVSIVLLALLMAPCLSEAQAPRVAEPSRQSAMPIRERHVPMHAILGRHCSGEKFGQVTAVADLPADVRQVILQRGPIADPGERFMEGDVAEAGVPDRRLTIAARGKRHLIAAVQIGGWRPTLEIWMFSRHGDRWQDGSVDRFVFEAPPVSVQELLYEVCEGYPKPAPRPPDAGIPPI